MCHLPGGKVFFNRWPVPATSWVQLLKVDTAVHDRMFPPAIADGGVLGGADESGDEAEPPTMDELALDANMRVPFPHEHNMILGLELINVFDVEVLVTTTVGSGEMFKAVLQKHKYGVGICKTKEHKKQVVQRLKEYAKLMNLVPLTNSPRKSAEMVSFEQQLQKKATAVPNAAVPAVTTTVVPKAAVPKADMPVVEPEQLWPETTTVGQDKVATTAIATPPKLQAFGSSLL